MVAWINLIGFVWQLLLVSIKHGKSKVVCEVLEKWDTWHSKEPLKISIKGITMGEVSLQL